MGADETGVGLDEVLHGRGQIRVDFQVLLVHGVVLAGVVNVVIDSGNKAELEKLNIFIISSVRTLEKTNKS